MGGKALCATKCEQLSKEVEAGCANGDFPTMDPSCCSGSGKGLPAAFQETFPRSDEVLIGSLKPDDEGARAPVKAPPRLKALVGSFSAPSRPPTTTMTAALPPLPHWSPRHTGTPQDLLMAQPPAPEPFPAPFAGDTQGPLPLPAQVEAKLRRAPSPPEAAAREKTESISELWAEEKHAPPPLPAPPPKKAAEPKKAMPAVEAKKVVAPPQVTASPPAHSWPGREEKARPPPLPALPTAVNAGPLLLGAAQPPAKHASMPAEFAFSDLRNAEELVYGSVFAEIRRRSGCEENTVPLGNPLLRSFLFAHSCLKADDLDAGATGAAAAPSLSKADFLAVLREHSLPPHLPRSRFRELKETGSARLGRSVALSALEGLVTEATGVTLAQEQWGVLVEGLVGGEDEPSEERWIDACQRAARALRLARCVGSLGLGSEPEAPPATPKGDAVLSEPPDEYSVTVDRSSGEALGVDTMDLDGVRLLIVHIHSKGLVGQWNAKRSGQAVREGDVILEVNGKKGLCSAIVEECRQSQPLCMRLLRQPALPREPPRVGATFPLLRNRCPGAMPGDPPALDPGD